jgi:ferredoxin-NADP reductase
MSKVKLLPGLLSLLRMAKARKAKMKAADSENRQDAVLAMARRMHPEELKLVVSSVTDETDTVRTYRLKSENGSSLPVFQSGQYLSVKLPINGSFVSRAYSLSSAPYEADGTRGYYEITIRRKPGGLVSGAVWDTWAQGVRVNATGPHGDFYISPLRDTQRIVAVAGGTGITPFVSMMKQLAYEQQGICLTLLYGCKDTEDVLFEKEIARLISRSQGQLRRVNTFENAQGQPGLCQGFIDAAFIRENVATIEDKTFFICGPPVMYDFLKKEFAKIAALQRKQMRYEISGTPDDVTRYAGFDTSAVGKSFSLKVMVDVKEHNITALATEPILIAVERAGLILDSRCRSGECGICRSKLVSGSVFILPDNDGRRAADKDLGYIHPCATYPLSDVTIIIPPGKAAQT